MSISTRAIKGFLFEMKKCSKCKEDKPFLDYYVDSNLKSGYMGACKLCFNIKHKTRRALYAKIYFIKNEVKLKEKKKIYIIKNAKIIQEKAKTERIKNKARNNLKNREYHIKNKEKIREMKKKYTEQNKQKINKRIREYNKKRKKTDTIFKLRITTRSRISNYIRQKGFIKKDSAQNILGASYQIVKKHLERQFTKGMSWENYGHYGKVWHIDHIIPLSSAKTEEETLKLFHYTNLQPLWAKDNLEKSDKIIPTQMILTI